MARAHRGDHDACRCVRPPARRWYVLALVAHFEVTWERAATCAWRLAPATLQLDAAADEISAQVASLIAVLTAANAATADVPIWLPDQGRDGGR